jgi:hypothetical protein
VRRILILLSLGAGLAIATAGAVLTVSTPQPGAYAAPATIGADQVGVGVQVVAPSGSPPPSAGPTPPPTAEPPVAGGGILPVTGTDGRRLLTEILAGVGAVALGSIVVWLTIAHRRRSEPD